MTCSSPTTSGSSLRGPTRSSTTPTTAASRPASSIGTGEVIPGWDESAGRRRRSAAGCCWSSRRPRATAPRATSRPASRAPTRWCSWSTSSRPTARTPSRPTPRRPTSPAVAELPKVEGDRADAAPTVTVAEGHRAAEGARPRPCIAKGDGERAQDQGQARDRPVQVAVGYAGEVLDSHLGDGQSRVASASAIEGQATPIDELAGVPVGSRVLLARCRRSRAATRRTTASRSSSTSWQCTAPAKEAA